MQNDFLQYMRHLYDKTARQMRFQGPIEDFYDWKPKARSKILELLQISDLPSFTDNIFETEFEILSEKQLPNYQLLKVQYQTLPSLVVSAYLLIPTQTDQPKPTILCPPGHGTGIDQVIFESKSSYHRYPEKLAEAGYVAFVPEHISFGYRSNPEPYHGCRYDHAALSLLGSTVIGYRMWELQRAIDLLMNLPCVDNDRIGCAGLSLGGEMTLYLAACDERIQVACVACFLTSFQSTFLKELHCTCGYVPQMAKYFEHADIATLISPRPLMIQAGDVDPSFLASDATQAYKELSYHYQALGAKDKVRLNIFSGGHEFDVQPAIEWFDQWL